MFFRIATIPLNDDHWHHVGFVWSGTTGVWSLLIDGVLWGTKEVFKGRTLPSGGSLFIGKIIESGVSYYLVGNINRLNFWSDAKSGSEIEDMAKGPASRDGDLIAWFRVKDFVSDARRIRPSMAVFSG